MFSRFSGMPFLAGFAFDGWMSSALIGACPLPRLTLQIVAMSDEVWFHSESWRAVAIWTNCP